MNNLKKTVSFRLSGVARLLLERIADKKGLNQTALLEMVIREVAEREGVTIPTAEGEK